MWVPSATCCLARLLGSALHGGAVSRKKICGGTVRSATREARGFDRKMRSRRERSRRRCAAIPGCRKFRSAHTKMYGTASSARKIAPHKLRSAMAVFPQRRRGSPPATGGGNAGHSHYDRADSLTGWFRSLLSPESIGEGAAISKSLYLI